MFLNARHLNKEQNLHFQAIKNMKYIFDVDNCVVSFLRTFTIINYLFISLISYNQTSTSTRKLTLNAWISHSTICKTTVSAKQRPLTGGINNYHASFYLCINESYQEARVCLSKRGEGGVLESVRVVLDTYACLRKRSSLNMCISNYNFTTVRSM